MSTPFYILCAILFVVPLWILAPKFRLPNWIALIAIVPFGIFIVLWLMAFRDKIKIPGIDR